MAESVTFNNAVYIIPDVGESNWGQNLTNYFVAIPQGCYQLSGGTAPLTADLSFGTNYGLLSKYFKSTSSNIAGSGQIRLANTDAIDWRNAANNADLALSVDSSNNLLWNGDIIATASASPVLSITGTADQIIASAATGNITLSTPQNIDSTATPTFASETLTASTNQLVLGTTRTLTITSPEPAGSSRTLTLPDPGGNDSVVYLALAQTLTNKSATTIVNPYDSTTKIASTAFVQMVEQLTMSTFPMTVSAGTYSFASIGSGCVATITTSTGVITAASVTAGGSNYKVGDLITVNNGNYDALLQVATLSGSAAATLVVVYGGTGYTNRFNGSLVAVSSTPFTFVLTGVLSSNVVVLLTSGTYLTQSNQWIVINNTTGAHTVTFQLGTNSDTATGTGVVIAQGSNNSTSRLIQSDGETDVWFVDSFPAALAGASVTGSGNVVLATAPTLTAVTLSNTTNQMVLGTTKTITISSTAPASSLTYTLPDAAHAANIVLDYGNYTIAGTWSFSAVVTVPNLTVTDGAAGETPIHFQNNGTNTFEFYSQTSGGGTDNLSIYSYAATRTMLTIPCTASNSGVFIGGTNTNDNAAAGQVGEYIVSTAGYAATGATGVYFDQTSINLTAGDWDLEGACIYAPNGATFSVVDVEIGISSHSGNSATGLTEGLNWIYNYATAPITFTYLPLTLPVYRVSISTSTTYYLKGFIKSFTVATPTVACSLRARRVR